MALRELIPLGVRSLRDPRGASRALLGLGLPVQHYWTAFLAVTVLATFLVQAVLYLAPPPETVVLADGTEVPLAPPNALQTLALIGGGLLLLAGLLHLGAKAFGGTGRFAEMVLAMVWLQAVMIGLNVASIPLLLAGLGGVVEIVLFAALFWMLGGFTAGIHGFDSAGKAVMAIVGGLFALALALSILIVALGGGA